MAYTVVTGASAGLGAVYADELGKEGRNMILIARRADRLEAIREEVTNKYGVDVKVAAFDLTDHAALDAWLADVKSLEIDGLINNAGFGVIGRFDENTLEKQLSMLELNVMALVRMSYALLPQIKAAKDGYIINVASTAAFQPGPFMALYYASKAAVLSFTEALHEELRSDGVRVSALCPGATETEFMDVADMRHVKLMKLGLMDARPVVRLSLKKRSKAVVIPGFKNKFLAFSTRITPRFIIRKISAGLQT